MAGQPAREVADAVRLAGTGRAVEQQTLLRRQPERAQRRSLFGEPQHVALDGSECRLREDHLVALDGFEIVNADPSRVAGPLRARSSDRTRPR